MPIQIKNKFLYYITFTLIYVITILFEFILVLITFGATGIRDFLFTLFKLKPTTGISVLDLFIVFVVPIIYLVITNIICKIVFKKNIHNFLIKRK
jgi:hypothetical protein